MNKRKSILCALLWLSVALGAECQELSVSTNVAGYLNLGTMNFEVSGALARHWSLFAGVKYNPFSYETNGGESVMQNRQRACDAGARYWPWHVYSGWWMSAKLRAQEFNSGGIFSEETREGERYGGGLAGGYTYMLAPHFNIDFGLGVWAGYESYTVYACPRCGKMLGAGQKTFILPSDLLLSLSYVF